MSALKKDLEELQKLLDDGTLTQKEYDAQRKLRLRRNEQRGAGRPKKRKLTGDDEASEEEEDGENQKTNETRKLLPTPQWGLGGDDDGDNIELFARRRKPWHLRQDLGNVSPANALEVREWLENDVKQLAFAQRFASPIECDVDLRKLHDNPARLEKNATSRLLHALMTMNRMTCAEVPRTNLINNIVLPQHVWDRRADVCFDGGPEGGLCGLADACLWKLDDSDDMVSTDPDLLELTSLLCEGTRTGNDVMLAYPAMATRFTAPRMQQLTSRGKVQEGARYVSPTNLAERMKRSPFKVIDDVDPTMRERVLSVRGDEKYVVPLEREVQQSDLMDVDFEDVEQEVECMGLFDIMLYKDILRGVDAQGNSRMIKIDMLYIKARFPACDPFIAMHQVAKMNPVCEDKLMQVLRHMNFVLGGNESQVLDMDTAFNTSTVRAAELCCEPLLVEGIMNFSQRQNIKGIHLGGIRADFDDEEERAIWREYTRGVVGARAGHYRAVCQRVNKDLKPNNIRYAEVPNEYRLDYYYGQHYRSVRHATLDALVEEAVGLNTDNVDVDLAHRLDQWRAKQLQDKNHVYIADGRALPRNTGLWTQVNIDAFEPYTNKSCPKRQPSRLMQQAQELPIARIFLMNRCEPLKDPLEIAWESTFIPDVEYMQQHMLSLPDELLTVVEEMTEFVTMSRMKEIKEQDLRTESLFRLYGQTPHRIHRTLINCDQFAELSSMARSKHAATLSAIKNMTVFMVTGELKHWSMAAKTVLDLKSSGARMGRQWLEDYAPFLRRLHNEGDLVLDETNVTSLFCADADRLLKFDISYQNQMTMDIMSRAITANFCFQSHAWGYPLRVADMACSCDVVTLRESIFKPGKLKTINMKTMGAGADSMVDHYCEQNNAYGKYLVAEGKLREFYSSQLAKDATNAQMSTLSIQTLRGSGLPMLGQTVDHNASPHALEAGTVIFRTEHNKSQTSAKQSQEFMANFETNIADSGGAEGTQRVGWVSTKAFQSISFRRMFSAPISLIAGNRQDDEFPESTLGGGRMVSVASAVPDGSQGTLHQNQHTGKACSRWSDMQAVQLDQRKAMRAINQGLVEQHMRFFLLKHLQRKALPFFHRTMTIGVKNSNYELLHDFSTMGNAVGAITTGLRRRYLSGMTELMRNIEGPWQSVCGFGTFVVQVLEWCTARALRNGVATDNGVTVDLHGAFMDALLALLNVPVTLTAKLSSLHLWLHMTVLDISAMTMMSFALFTVDFKDEHCSMQVLARVIRGLPLDDDQKKQYDRLCAFLHPLVISRQCDLRRHPTAINVKAGHLDIPELDTLKMWFDFKDDDGAKQQSIMASAANQVRHTSRQARSPYVKSSSVLVTMNKPSWLTSKGHEVLCPFKTGSSPRIIAQAFADQMTPEACETRGKTRVQRPREHFHEFWEAAATGVRLPRGGSKAQDSNQLQHDPVWQTGFWMNQNVELLGPMEQLTRHFLLLCGLPSDVTHVQFFERLMAPYICENAPGSQICTSAEWNKPLIQGDAFKWVASPHIGNHVVDGVETGLSIKLVSLILFQALVAKDWGDYMKVHLRSMGQMSLEITSLLAHTRLEKACIPANNGTIPLLSRSPMHNFNKAAELWYDPELHVDPSMICLAARQEQCWEWLDLDTGHILIHRNLRSQMQKDPQSLADLFPFPPESTYHMPTHGKIMQIVYGRYANQNPRDFGNGLANAMFEYGQSVTSDMVKHIPATLTHCMQSREIPCVTFKEGYIFCLRIGLTFCEIVPVKKVLADNYAPLPIDQPLKFAKHFLGDVIARGLRCEDNEIKVQVRSSSPGSPFYFYPCINWPHLVVFSSGSRVVRALPGNEKTELHLVYIDVLKDMMTLDPDEASDDWWGENFDMPRIPGVKIYEQSDSWFIKHEQGLLFCQERTEMVHMLLRLLRKEMTGWIETQFGLRDVDNKILPIFRKPNGDRVCYRYEYDEEAHLEMLREFQEEKINLSGNKDWLTRHRNSASLAEIQDTEKMINTRATRLANLQRQLQAVQPISFVEILLQDDFFLDVTLPDANRGLFIGSVIASDNHDNFLQDGMYTTEYYDTAQDSLTMRRITLDFVTLSQCIVQEGAPLWLKITPLVYHDLCLSNLRFGDRELHAGIQDETINCSLMVCYVLGGLAGAPHVAVRVKNDTGAPGSDVMFLRVSIKHDNALLLAPNAVCCRKEYFLTKNWREEHKQGSATTVVWAL